MSGCQEGYGTPCSIISSNLSKVYPTPPNCGVLRLSSPGNGGQLSLGEEEKASRSTWFLSNRVFKIKQQINICVILTGLFSLYKNNITHYRKLDIRS